MYGEGKTRGKCAELRIPATTNQALAALQVEANIRDYLRLFLEHNYEETRKVASGGVQPNLNLGLVRSVVVPLPPQVEQVRIVKEVDTQLTTIRALASALHINGLRSKQLRAAVLGQAFTSSTD